MNIVEVFLIWILAIDEDISLLKFRNCCHFPRRCAMLRNSEIGFEDILQIAISEVFEIVRTIDKLIDIYYMVLEMSLQSQASCPVMGTDYLLGNRMCRPSKSLIRVFVDC